MKTAIVNFFKLLFCVLAFICAFAPIAILGNNPALLALLAVYGVIVMLIGTHDIVSSYKNGYYDA